MKTVKQQFTLGDIPVFTGKMIPPTSGTMGERLIGLELETEKIPYDPNKYVIHGLMAEKDNSLRSVNGLHHAEFITEPANYDSVMVLLEAFFKKAKFTADNYTERCSVHVHVNAQDLNKNNLETLFSLYQVVERLLFRWVGEDRDKNIFCVPWYDTALNYQVLDHTSQFTRGHMAAWQKYTALNMLPLVTQGTLEFRHMPGTCDLIRISNWLQIIGRMFTACLKYQPTELQEVMCGLNTNSFYKNFIQEIFQEEATLLYTDGWEQLVEQGVLEYKYMLCGKMVKEKEAPVVKRQQVPLFDGFLRGTEFVADQRGAVGQPDQIVEDGQVRLQQLRRQLEQR